MTTPMIDLQELIEKSSNGDRLREMFASHLWRCRRSKPGTA